MTAPNAGRPWMDLELAALRRMRAAGWTYLEIGVHLGRHADQCQAKAAKLGLPRVSRVPFGRAPAPTGDAA